MKFFLYLFFIKISQKSLKNFTKKIIQFFSLIILFVFFTSQNSFAISPFSDINESHKNYKAVNELYKRGIIGGYSDGTFKPSKTLNRVEALKILLLGASIDVDNLSKNSSSFSDTDSKAWYFKYIAAAKNLGIVGGYPDGTFKPANNVNLAESMKMLIETNGVNYEKNISNSPYFDVSSDTWFAGYFDYVKKNNLIDSNNGKINPGKDISRAEFCESIYRLIKVIETEKINEITAGIYSDSSIGKKTESGEDYSKDKLTAGHRTFAFGTQLKITNTKTGNSVIVIVNDKGPENLNREIRLSHKAFNLISSADEKILSVKIEEISSKTEIKNTNEISDSCEIPKYDGTIDKKYFDNIELSSDINDDFLEGEIYNISGKVTNGSKDFIIFIREEDGGNTNFIGKVSDDGFFSADVGFGKVGSKQIGIIAGKGGNSYVANVDVHGISCEKKFDTIFEIKPKNLRFKIKNNETYLKWDGKGDVSKIIFLQGEEKIVKYLNKKADFLKINPIWFKNFAEGEILWQVSLAGSSNNSIFGQNKGWNISETKKVQITKHYYSKIDKNILEVFDMPNTYFFGGKIEFNGRIKDEVRIIADIILPNNSVDSIELQSSNKKIENSNGIIIYPKLSNFSFSYKPKEHGTYIVEVNHVSGGAGINVPIYEDGFMPIIPDFKDLANASSVVKKIDKVDKNKSASEMLSLINKSRASVGLSKVMLNSSLAQLAQERAEDMAERDYISHWTPEGKTSDDLRFTYGIKTSVAENIATEISVEFAHFGLMRSAAHRKNILNKQWKRVGLGFAKSKHGNIIVVQLFSDSPILESNIENMRTEIIDTINEKRTKYLVPSTTLHAISQNWVDKMVDENFFDFDDGNGGNLYESISQAGINSTVSYFILAHSARNGLIDEIKKNEGLFESQWKKVGVGIKQNDFGVINIVLVYTY